MKRIAFAHVEKIYDFTTEKEAKLFIEQISSDKNKAVIGQYKNNLDGFTYTVKIWEKYKDYETGF